MLNPIALAMYLGIFSHSLQIKVKLKSTTTPESPTTPNLKNFQKKGQLRYSDMLKKYQANLKQFPDVKKGLPLSPS